MTQVFPLTWPTHVARRAPDDQRAAKFRESRNKITVASAIIRLQEEANRMGAEYTVLSTNVELKMNGMPRSGQREPDDPGVAFWFQLDGKSVCLPCDTFNRVADNISAIAAHINATRAIERYGVATAAQMFEGFVALAAPSNKRSWMMVLDFLPNDRSQITADVINSRYRSLAKKRHPEAGGSAEAMAELNVARDEALKEIAA